MRFFFEGNLYMDTTGKIAVGKINGFQGLKGYVKIFSETRPRDAIFGYDHLFVFRNNAWQKLEVEDAAYAGKSLVIKFKGFIDRTAIEPYYGLELFIENSQLKALDEGEFYLADLMGLTVKNEAGFIFGEVTEFLETGANDVLVARKNGQECLIPFTVGHTVIQVDLEAKEILVDWDEDDI